MRTADLTTALLLIAGALLVIWDSWRLGFGWGTDGPQSGFFTFWLATLMIAACAALIGQTLRKADRRPFVTREQLRPVLTVLLPAVGFVALTQVIGLYVSAAIYLAFYMRWIGRYPWVTVLLVSVAFPVVTFIIFEQWFLVPMPKGPVEAFLGY